MQLIIFYENQVVVPNCVYGSPIELVGYIYYIMVDDFSFLQKTMFHAWMNATYYDVTLVASSNLF